MATTSNPKTQLTTKTKIAIGVGAAVLLVVIIAAIVMFTRGGRTASPGSDVQVAPTAAAAEAFPALNKAQLLARNATKLHQNLVGFK